MREPKASGEAKKPPASRPPARTPEATPAGLGPNWAPPWLGTANAISGGAAPPPSVLRRVETLTATSLTDVTVHEDARADTLVRSMDADGLAVGPNVFLARDLGSRRDTIVAHELAHRAAARQQATPARRSARDRTEASDPVESWADEIAARTDRAVPNVLVDDGRQPDSGQAQRTPFLDRLEPQVVARVEAVIGPEALATECAYLRGVFALLRRRTAEHCLRMAAGFVGDTFETADQLADRVLEEVGRRAQRWRDHGELPSLRGLLPNLRGPRPPAEPIAPIARKARGRPLDAETRAQMQTALGRPLGDVRVQDDAAGDRTARLAGAPAAARGKEIAFARGVMAPDDVGSQAILLHELAHAASFDPRAPEASNASVEADADRAAMTGLMRLHLDRPPAPAPLRAHGGLTLRRCGGDPPPPISTDRARALITELRGLYTTQREIVEGSGDASQLEPTRARIAVVTTELRTLGVNRDDESLRSAVLAGTDILRVTGRLVRSPEAPPGAAETPWPLGTNLRYTVALDYVPPGRSVHVAWRWRARGQTRLYQFLSAPGRSGTQTLELDPAFWSIAGMQDVRRGGGLVVEAALYLGDGDTAVRRFSIDTPISDEIPTTLSLLVPPSIVVGEPTAFRVREWSPLHFDYPARTTVEWSIDGNVQETGVPVFHHTFGSVGSHRVRARIVRDERGTRTVLRTIEETITARTGGEIGRAELARTADEARTALPTLPGSISTSIRELRAREEHGGEQAAYWRRRREAQEHRRSELLRHVPDIERLTTFDPQSTAPAPSTFTTAVRAVLVMPRSQGVQHLGMHMIVRPRGATYSALLLDTTGRDVLTFTGTGASIDAACRAAFSDWRSDNPYPLDGTVVYDLRHPGGRIQGEFGTRTPWRTAMRWIEGIIAIGGLMLMMAAPPMWAAIAFIAASAAVGAVHIWENIDRGIPATDQRNILEGISIILAFAGGTGSAMRHVGLTTTRATVYRAGSWMVLASVVGDLGTLVYTTSDALAQLRAIQADPTLDDSQRTLQTLQLIGALVAQGVLVFVANRDMFRGGLRRSDYFHTDTDATAARLRGSAGPISLEPGARIDVASELLAAGEARARLAPPSGRTPAPGAHPGYSDRELLQRLEGLRWLQSGQLTRPQTAAMLEGLSTPALRAMGDITATEAHGLFTRYGAAAIDGYVPHLGGARLKDLDGALTPAKMRRLFAEFDGVELRALSDSVPGDTLSRLMNGMRDVELRQFWTGLQSSFGNIARGSSVADLRQMERAWGFDAMRWAGTELSGPEARTLFGEIGSRAAVQALTDVTPARARQLMSTFSPDVVRAAAVQLRGEGFETLVRRLGAETAAGIAQHRVAQGDVPRLAAHAQRLATAEAPGGVLANVAPLDPGSIIVDTNYLRYAHYAADAAAAGRTPSSIEANVAAHQAAMPAGSDLRTPAVAVGETPVTPHTPGHRGFAIDVPRDGADYRGLLSRLSGHGVGQGSGPSAAADRGVVADAFFASTSGTPTFVTTDRRVAEGLLRMEVARQGASSTASPAALRRQILDPTSAIPASRTPTVYDAAAGFTVTDPGSGRSLRIVPIGG